MVTRPPSESPPGSGAYPRRGPSGQAGYNMVMLVVIIAVLTTAMAAALPAWSNWIRREKEEELIFRGLQYAEAIRVFQKRFGRPPVRLEELIQVEPRSIRRLWKDPVTGKNDWGLVFANAGVPVPPQQRPGPDGRDGSATGSGGRAPTPSSGGDTVTQGPISGVYSLAEGDSIKTFNGKNKYSEWIFSADLIDRKMTLQSGLRGDVVGQPRYQGAPDLSSRWIGRPWPPQIEEQMTIANQPGVPGNPAGANPLQGDATRPSGQAAPRPAPPKRR